MADQEFFVEDIPENIPELVRFMASGLVHYPDDVKVELVEGDWYPVIELRVNPEDLGHVIGRNGRTAKAMRLLVNAAATRAQVRVALDILDEDE